MWRKASSHARLSNFLDDMTYHHALAGGASHGGVSLDDKTHSQILTSGAIHRGISTELVPHARQLFWLEVHWSRAQVGPECFDMGPDVDEWPTLYIRDGQALYWQGRWEAVAGSDEALDEIAQALQLTWARRW